MSLSKAQVQLITSVSGPCYCAYWPTKTLNGICVINNDSSVPFPFSIFHSIFIFLQWKDKIAVKKRSIPSIALPSFDLRRGLISRNTPVWVCRLNRMERGKWEIACIMVSFTKTKLWIGEHDNDYCIFCSIWHLWFYYNLYKILKAKNTGR